MCIDGVNVKVNGHFDILIFKCKFLQGQIEGKGPDIITLSFIGVKWSVAQGFQPLEKSWNPGK